MKECINYQNKDQGAVVCQVCNHFCFIKQGEVGVCGIRQNRQGKLYLLAYGRAAAVNIDPIEKKPLFHFLPSSSTFSIGTIGCNFRCLNCQNHDISQMFETKRKVTDYDKLPWGQALRPEAIVALAKQENCQSIAYTYNEPTVFLEYALDTMKLAKGKGLKNVWVSNGYMTSQTLAAIEPYLDAINIDIKSFDNDFYRRTAGAQLKPVLDNCQRLAKNKNIWLEITTLIIPTLSDDPEMLKKLAGFIKNELGADVPWHVSAFSGAISWRLKDLPDTPLSAVEMAYDIGRQAGLRYVYTGNVWAGGKEHTYCPHCQEVVIERNGYNITRYDQQGRCQKCAYQLAGLFMV